MIKGLEKDVRGFVAKIRESKFYEERLNDEEAIETIAQVKDYLPKTEACSEFAYAIHGLIGFVASKSLAVKMIALAALLYFLLPLDIIPDYIPVAGLADDTVVLGVSLNQIRSIYLDML